MRHMELVDLMIYHDVSYVNCDAPGCENRVVEHAMNLNDLASRLMAGNVSNRPNNIRKRALVVAGESINLTALLPDYHENPKKTARLATEALALNTSKIALKGSIMKQTADKATSTGSKLPLSVKLGFGIGDLGGNLFFTAMGFTR